MLKGRYADYDNSMHVLKKTKNKVAEEDPVRDPVRDVKQKALSATGATTPPRRPGFVPRRRRSRYGLRRLGRRLDARIEAANVVVVPKTRR